MSDTVLKEETYHVCGVGWGSMMCELFHYVLMTHKCSNMDGCQPRLKHSNKTQTNTETYIKLLVLLCFPSIFTKTVNIKLILVLFWYNIISHKLLINIQFLSYLSDCLQWCPMFQQQFHHLHSVLLTGNMKRCETVLLM